MRPSNRKFQLKRVNADSPDKGSGQEIVEGAEWNRNMFWKASRLWLSTRAALAAVSTSYSISAKEEFGIKIRGVREVMGIEDITLLPLQAAEVKEVKGVIDSRGEVVPVVDLRLRFGLPEENYTHQSCVIVAEVGSQASPLLVGIIAEGTAEVLDLAPADCADAQDFGDEMVDRK